jgi:hypothetical protein
VAGERAVGERRGRDRGPDVGVVDQVEALVGVDVDRRSPPTIAAATRSEWKLSPACVAALLPGPQVVVNRRVTADNPRPRADATNRSTPSFDTSYIRRGLGG